MAEEHDEWVKHMVDRFLGWKLPENFHPDGGISFKAGSQPVGTNLFDAGQAEAMVRYMLEDLQANHTLRHEEWAVKPVQHLKDEWASEVVVAKTGKPVAEMMTVAIANSIARDHNHALRLVKALRELTEDCEESPNEAPLQSLVKKARAAIAAYDAAIGQEGT